MMTKVKNILLLCTFVLSQLPSIFYGSTERLNLSLFVERSTRIDFFVLYYVTALNFLILAYCIHYPKGLNRTITRLILIITALDLIHLITMAQQVHGMGKVAIALGILGLCEFYIYKRKWLR